jgi:hypothetical protein
MWGVLSDEWTGLSFTIASGARHRSHFRFRAPWDSWPYFAVSDLRLPFSSPPTTRRLTVEVFDPASSREISAVTLSLSLIFNTALPPTASQPVSLGIKCPCWGLRPDIYDCKTVASLLMWALCLTRGRVCRLKLLLALTSAVVFGSESSDTPVHILLSQIRHFPFRRRVTVEVFDVTVPSFYRTPLYNCFPFTLPAASHKVNSRSNICRYMR